MTWSTRSTGPVYVAARPVLAELTGYDVHRGALAAMDRKPLPSVAEVLSGARRVVVLEDVNDHTNIGAIFRSAAGLGMDAVLVTPRCADPLYRRSVKVSMGAVFSVPWTRLGSWPADICPAAGSRTGRAGAHPRCLGGADRRSAPEVRSRAALILGAEGPGLQPRTLAEVGTRVRIPMSAGVDSLNVGAAAAVAFYALTR